MAQSYRFLRVSATVFKVLAVLVVVVQVITGLILLIGGGDLVAIGNLEIPARIVGVLNFVAAGLYFFSFWLMSNLIQLLLDIRERLPASPVGGPARP